MAQNSAGALGRLRCTSSSSPFPSPSGLRYKKRQDKFESVSVTWMLMTKYFCFLKNKRISRSPRLNKCPSSWVVTPSFCCPFVTIYIGNVTEVPQPILIIGLSRKHPSIIASVVRYASSARTSLYISTTNPPFLHVNAYCLLKLSRMCCMYEASHSSLVCITAQIYPEIHLSIGRGQ